MAGARMQLLVYPVPLLCRLWHPWVEDHNTHKTVYEECSRCGSRRAWQHEGGYQPIDTTWVMDARRK